VKQTNDLETNEKRMSEFPPTWISASELTTLYGRNALSPVGVVEAMLLRASKLQPHLNAFVMIDADGARAAAKASEARWKAGTPLSPLDGVPTTIKDTTPVKGWPTRYGSHATDETPAIEDAPVAGRLRAAGMVILGKSTTPEFGWKALTDSPLQGTTRNPWNLKHSPGGSSGGASSLTAAGINPFNHGNDGGGSIRIPASHTGLVGLKPSYGRIAQHPADSPFADVIHPQTRQSIIGIGRRRLVDAVFHRLGNLAEGDPAPAFRKFTELFRPFRARRVLGFVTQGGVAALLALGYILSPRWGCGFEIRTHAGSASFVKGRRRKEEFRKGRGKRKGRRQNEELRSCCFMHSPSNV
jgi:hypothetical protein